MEKRLFDSIDRQESSPRLKWWVKVPLLSQYSDSPEVSLSEQHLILECRLLSHVEVSKLIDATYDYAKEKGRLVNCRPERSVG